jgi:hypothetical protein
MSKNPYRPIIQKALSSKVNIEKKYYGYLGSGLDVAVPGRPGYVYVTLNDGMVIIAYNQAVPPTLNYPVVVGYDPNQTSKHTLVVLGTRTIPREGSTDNNTFAVAPHHASHEYGNSNGGNDVVYVHTRQLLPLRPTPTGGFNLHIYSDVQKVNGIWAQVGGITLDLSSHQQTGFVSGSTGDSKWVLISLSLTSGSIIQTSGSVKAIGELSANDLPTLPVQNLPICAIRFWSGQTEIFEGYTGTDLLDLRMTKRDDGTLSGLTDVSISGSQSPGQVLTWISGSPGYWGPTYISGSTVNHNDLSSIQGGSASERYHLTSAELTKLQTLSGSTASNSESFLTSGSSNLPNYRKLVPGQNIILDYSVPNELAISGSGLVTTLAGLSDVSISGSQSIGQVLTWNGVKWSSGDIVASGSVVPVSPVANQFFLHTPTGRKVLMQYVGTTWYPLTSFGTLTTYVDGTDGTDSVDKGHGVDANAYKTLAYAWTQIPSTFNGNVVVNVAAGTYTETLNCTGKMAGVSGAIITIQGTLSTLMSGSISSAVQGSGSMAGSITVTSGSMATDEHKGKFVVTNQGTRVIKSNTLDTLYIVSTFTGIPSGTFTISEPTTIIDGGGVRGNCLIIQHYQAVYFRYFKFTNSTSIDVYPVKYAECSFTYCTFTPASGKYIMQTYLSHVIVQYCAAIHNGNSQWYLYGHANFALWGSLLYQSVGTKSGTGITINQNSVLLLNVANDLGNFAVAITATDGARVSTGTSASGGYNFIHDNTTGLSAAISAAITGTANNQYSGNTADESATAASFGYID